MSSDLKAWVCYWVCCWVCLFGVPVALILTGSLLIGYGYIAGAIPVIAGCFIFLMCCGMWLTQACHVCAAFNNAKAGHEVDLTYATRLNI